MPKETTEIDIFVGSQVTKYRHARGYSAQNVADVIGVSHQQLQKYEKGINKISVGRLVKISEALEVPITLLINGSSLSEEDTFFNDESVRRRSNLELMKYFSKLSIKKQKSVIRFIKLIADDAEREKQMAKEIERRVKATIEDVLIEIKKDPKWGERSAADLLRQIQSAEGSEGE